MSRHPVPLEGRFAIVTDVGAGCGGRGRRLDEGAGARTVKSCGPDASTLASSWWKSFSANDGGKKARSPGRSRISRKTIAWGMSGDPGDLAVNTRVHTHYPHAHTRLRVRLAPGIPRALFGGRTYQATFGRIASRKCGGVPKEDHRHCERSEAIHSYFVAAWIASRSLSLGRASRRPVGSQ
jgi:hypothetical protein